MGAPNHQTFPSDDVAESVEQVAFWIDGVPVQVSGLPLAVFVLLDFQHYFLGVLVAIKMTHDVVDFVLIPSKVVQKRQVRVDKLLLHEDNSTQVVDDVILLIHQPTGLVDLTPIPVHLVAIFILQQTRPVVLVLEISVALVRVKVPLLHSVDVRQLNPSALVISVDWHQFRVLEHDIERVAAPDVAIIRYQIASFIHPIAVIVFDDGNPVCIQEVVSVLVLSVEPGEVEVSIFDVAGPVSLKIAQNLVDVESALARPTSHILHEPVNILSVPPLGYSQRLRIVPQLSIFSFTVLSEV